MHIYIHDLLGFFLLLLLVGAGCKVFSGFIVMNATPKYLFKDPIELDKKTADDYALRLAKFQGEYLKKYPLLAKLDNAGNKILMIGGVGVSLIIIVMSIRDWFNF